MLPGYSQRKSELTELAERIYAAAAKLQDAAANLLEAQRLDSRQKILQQMFNRIANGQIDIEDVVDWAVSNGYDPGDTDSTETVQGTLPAENLVKLETVFEAPMQPRACEA